MLLEIIVSDLCCLFAELADCEFCLAGRQQREAPDDGRKFGDGIRANLIQGGTDVNEEGEKGVEGVSGRFASRCARRHDRQDLPCQVTH